MLSRELIRTIATGEAEKLWKLYGFSSPRDLVLEDLALARGVIVTEGPLDSMDARLIRQGNHGLIRVKQDIPEAGRKRFAIAHELGHWELHKATSQLCACTSDDMVASYKASVPEADANHFAAGLLMPEFLFVGQARNRGFCVIGLSDLASVFGTSLTATAIRFVDVSKDYVAVVVSVDGRIKWWRASDRFEDRFWLEAGSSLSKNTAAYDISVDPSSSKGPIEVDIEAWSERGSDSDSFVFIEESIYMAKYHQILSLLRLP